MMKNKPPSAVPIASDFVCYTLMTGKGRPRTEMGARQNNFLCYCETNYQRTRQQPRQSTKHLDGPARKALRLVASPHQTTSGRPVGTIGEVQKTCSRPQPTTHKYTCTAAEGTRPAELPLAPDWDLGHLLCAHCRTHRETVFYFVMVRQAYQFQRDEIRKK